MGATGEMAAVLAAKFTAVFPHLDERQQRLVAGAEARSLGHGGIAVVARAAGLAEVTVSRGVAELEAGQEPLGRARRPGGGRKQAAEADGGLVAALLALVEPAERGDPQSPLRWTVKSTRSLAGELTVAGHKVSADTVRMLLRQQGFSLQGNAKTIEGRAHPDRDAQFRYISQQAREHMAAGQPVVSVDAKKKEQVGDYAAAGREWRPAGSPVRVRSHDFADETTGTAIPYGIYDLAANTGWVNVGTDGNTAAFAVESIRRWWNGPGQAACPGASRLLITADAGGSNGYRTRAWKAGLAQLAAQTGLEITCCHFPPGTSKWNKIEHRLFSHISMNWRGRPLTSHQVIVNTIAAATTRTGLQVHAELDPGSYPTGIKISKQQMAALPLARHDFHGDWNYCLHPHSADTAPPPAATTAPATRPRISQTALSAPALTGISRHDLAALTTTITTSWNASREAALYQHRGGPRRINVSPEPYHGKLDLTDQILITLLHQRLRLPRYLLAPVFGADRTTIAQAITRTRPLTDQHLPPIQPAPDRAALLRELCHHAQAAGITLPAKIKNMTKIKEAC